MVKLPSLFVRTELVLWMNFTVTDEAGRPLSDNTLPEIFCEKALMGKQKSSSTSNGNKNLILEFSFRCRLYNVYIINGN